jgi:hypothetical protein
MVAYARMTWPDRGALCGARPGPLEEFRPDVCGGTTEVPTAAAGPVAAGVVTTVVRTGATVLVAGARV